MEHKSVNLSFGVPKVVEEKKLEKARRSFRNSIICSVFWSLIFSLSTLLSQKQPVDVNLTIIILVAENIPVISCLLISNSRVRTQKGIAKLTKAEAAEKEKEREFANMAKRFDEETKSRLTHLIEKDKPFKLEQIASELGISEKSLEFMIYEMVGEGRINGEFVDGENIFVLFTSLDEFIIMLDNQFQSWSNREKTTLVKKV